MQKLFPLLLLAPLAIAHAQSPNTIRPGPNDTQVVVAGHEGARGFHERWRYAPAIRTGDFIVMAGLIAAPVDGTDSEAFKKGLRQAFAHLEGNLKTLDASLSDVVKITTYHVFTSDYFDGSKMAHMEAVRAVKQEFMGATTPTWSAIGVSELFTDDGLVEIELTAYAPLDKE